MNEYFSKSYPEDLSNLLNYSLINGYKGGMKYYEFKKLFPKFKLKHHSYIGINNDKKSQAIVIYRMENAGANSEYYVTISNKGLKLRVMELEQVFTYSSSFSPEKLQEYQQKILDEIKFYDNLFNLKPLSYKSSKADAGYVEAMNVMQSMSQEDLVKLVKASNPKLSDQEISSAIQMMG